MCRLVAYCGPSIPLENIIVQPSHSLIVQSQVAAEAKLAVNGDGFGLAWYGAHGQPALYKEIMPAWANPNLLHICRAVQSATFLAHVRASTFGGASYQNCHPFSFGRWSFVHNGQIGGFEKLRRLLENRLPDPVFAARSGITDSELLFLLIIAHGLENDPREACTNAINEIEQLHKEAACTQPLRLTFVLSDGHCLLGCRYSSDGRSPTLYVSGRLDRGGICLASEPLDGNHGTWNMLGEATYVTVNRQQQTDFFPVKHQLSAA
jgi:predicted glutamine amidotransferase